MTLFDRRDLRVNISRMKKNILDLASIGATPHGGVSRLALTNEDKIARQTLVSWMKETGLEVIVDQMGNMRGRHEGKNPSLPPIVIGSHIDTQPFGGKFDGAYGVLGALEVLRTIAENKTMTTRSIEIFAWTNEEGTRFQPAMMGSGVFAGIIDLQAAYKSEDKHGKRFGEELEGIGFKGEIVCQPRKLHAYLELHIEQGPILEKQHVQIGVVQGIVGIAWLMVTVKGEPNHSGSTPMDSRKDALVVAANAVRMVRNAPLKIKGLAATVGSFDVYPNSINIIPGKVVFTIDFRCFNDERLDDAITVAKEEIMSMATQEKCEASIELLERFHHVDFAKKTVRVVEKSASKLGLRYSPIISGAGHDAQCLNKICDTAMIFVPSRRGRSHCEDEDTDWEDLESGANVLLESTLTLANET